MQEFLLLVRNESADNNLETLSQEQQQALLQQVRSYIGALMKEGKLKGAQRLDNEGKVLRKESGKFKDGPFNEAKEVIAGYFHVVAADMEEAIEIAKRNPMFEFSPGSIEVRPIKTVQNAGE